jgi:MFS family permease
MAAINHETKPPVGLKWRSNTFFILTTVAIGMFTDLFLFGLVVPIVPFILSDRISIPHDEIQYYTSLLLACYAGAQFLFSIPVAIIADKLPARQVPFLFGLSALLGATVMLWVGQTIQVLILARILQGMSGAVVWTIGLALVLDTVGNEKLGVTIGSIFSFISVGELMAPVLGGVVYKKAGSAAVFGMGFGLLAIDFIMRLAVIEKKVAAKWIPNAVTKTSASTLAHNDEEEASEGSPLLGNANRNGHTNKHSDLEQWKIPKDQSALIRRFPIIYAFSNSRMLTAQAVGFVQAMLLAVFDATIPTEAQDLFGFDSLKAGLLFTPLVLPYLILGPVFGRLTDKYGPKAGATFGLSYIMIPLILLRIPNEGGTPEIAKFCVFLSMCGLGLATVSSPSVVESSNVMEKYHLANPDLFGEEGPYAQLYAVGSMVFSAGLTVGPMVAGSLRTQIGYGNMSAVVAGACFVVSVLSFLYLGGKPKILSRRAR